MRNCLTGACCLLLVSACSWLGSPALTSCEAPRPQVCTMEYAPVCAELIAGGNKDYSSACNACADDTVASYADGTCPDAS